MTLPSQNTACQCNNKNCSDCKCGCDSCCRCSIKTCTDGSCRCDASPAEKGAGVCPFLDAHPNWQKCPFMSKMFVTSSVTSAAATDTADASNVPADLHSTCDSSKCAQIPMTRCTSCHETPELRHTVTLQMDTDMATDQTEETAL